MYGSRSFIWNLESPLLGSDACRPALWMDAPMIRRALFERSELARPPETCVHLIS